MQKIKALVAGITEEIPLMAGQPRKTAAKATKSLKQRLWELVDVEQLKMVFVGMAGLVRGGAAGVTWRWH